jgi:hypothetical protein
MRFNSWFKALKSAFIHLSSFDLTQQPVTFGAEKIFVLIKSIHFGAKLTLLASWAAASLLLLGTLLRRLKTSTISSGRIVVNE